MDLITVTAMLTALTLLVVLLVRVRKDLLEMVSSVLLVCKVLSYVYSITKFKILPTTPVGSLVVQFNRSNYIVVEGDTVELTLILSQQVEEAVTVEVSTLDFTTEGIHICTY